MYLRSIHLLNFKNWQDAALDLDPKLNCFTGMNGSGKTNLLDAIHYLSVCKSYFNAVDSQNIRDEEEFFVVEGDFEKEKDSFKIYCAVRRGHKKVFRKNKKEYQRLADHIGQFPSVIISPYDRDLITEGSDVRRRFIDSVISQSDPIYLDDLMRYNKALQQRNSLLKFFAANQQFDRESLEVYNYQLQEKGHPIHHKRSEFAGELNQKLQYYYELISGGREATSLEYCSQISKGNLTDLLEENLQKDRLNQYTGVGIHKDDLSFSLDERPLKKFGSQGQQKSFLIALKLAQYDFLANRQQVKPILLLDDIFDKLDESRVAHLVKLVHDESFGQIFITDTHTDRTRKLVSMISENYRLFEVENGKLKS